MLAFTERLRRSTRSAAGVCGGSFPGICRVTFPPAGPNQILEIDNVSCVTVIDDSSPNEVAFLTNNPNPDALPVAVIPAAQTIDLGAGELGIASNVGGPYFFHNEAIFIFIGGNGSSSLCTISGFSSPIN